MPELQDSALATRENSLPIPATQNVVGNSEDFHAIIRQTFPADVSNEVCALHNNDTRGCSRLGLLLTVLFCIAVILLGYHFWPQPIPPVETKEIKLSDKSKNISKEYAELAKTATKLLDNKEYNSCAHLLLPQLDKLLSINPENDKLLWKENKSLFVLYFECVVNGRLQFEYLKKCLNFLEILQKLEPDEIKWHAYELLLKSRSVLDGFESVTSGDTRRIERAKDCLALAKTVQHMDADKNQGKNKAPIELIQARLLTLIWLLSGIPNGLPDDEGDIGVNEREEAYKIALRYPDNADFLRLRLLILRKMILHSGYFNSYYFQGQKYYRNVYLEDECKTIENILKVAK